MGVYQLDRTLLQQRKTFHTIGLTCLPQALSPSAMHHAGRSDTDERLTTCNLIIRGEKPGACGNNWFTVIDLARSPVRRLHGLHSFIFLLTQHKISKSLSIAPARPSPVDAIYSKSMRITQVVNRARLPARQQKACRMSNNLLV